MTTIGKTIEKPKTAPVRSVLHKCKVEFRKYKHRKNQIVPKLSFRGLWLAAAGFTPGKRAELVQLTNGIIQLRAI